MNLRERFQTPCGEHEAPFGQLKAALTDAEAAHQREHRYMYDHDPCQMLRSTLHQLWAECQGCQAATLAAARKYAADSGQRARIKLDRQPACRRCGGRYGQPRHYPRHTHNAEGGFAFCVPGPPVPMGYPAIGSEWATWLGKLKLCQRIVADYGDEESDDDD